MSMMINTNMASIVTQRALGMNSDALSTSMQRLSTGLRVNSSKDDAAGLSIGVHMTTQIRGMSVAVRNANDAISMAQTTEGAIGEMTNVLGRMRDLTLQAANTGAVSSSDRNKLNAEFQQLGKELLRTIQNTSFNGQKVLVGGASRKNFQIGWGGGLDNQISLTITNMSLANGTSGLMSLAGIGVTQFSIGSGMLSQTQFSTVLQVIDRVVDRINDTRAKLGAIQSRFMSTIANLNQSIENNTAARSRIMDTDFATETANLSRNQIMQQAATSMLTQANQSNQGALSLLR
jgi:flagellin